MKITWKKRSSDYIAWLRGNKAVWECGKTADEAIARLILHHAKDLGITIEEEKS